MTFIDTHAHIYPDAIAEHAAASIADFYDIPVCMDGRLSSLLTHGAAAGVSRFLVHSVAMTPERVRSINDYLMRVCAEHPEKLIGFGTMHPDCEDVAGELRRMRAGGLRGVKLHPDIQKFLLDSDASVRMFEHFAAADMPALVHMGDYRYPYSQPERMASVLRRVPELKVICAHLGGWSVWSDAWKTLAELPGVWVDTSSSLYALAPDEAAAIIRRYGTDRVFFGTDFPMWKPEDEVARFMALPLTEDERERISHLNFEQFMESIIGRQA